MANGHGGARPGAGRKPRASKHAGAIADAEQRIADRLPELVDHLLKLAAGVLVQSVDKDGGTDVFLTPPDRAANVYLIDRILGKPTDRHEVTGEDGEPFKVYVGIDLDRI